MFATKKAFCFAAFFCSNQSLCIVFRFAKKRPCRSLNHDMSTRCYSIAASNSKKGKGTISVMYNDIVRSSEFIRFCVLLGRRKLDVDRSSLTCNIQIIWQIKQQLTLPSFYSRLVPDTSYNSILFPQASLVHSYLSCKLFLLHDILQVFG